jgi:hypothetical protein
MEVQIAGTEGEVRACWRVTAQLRTALAEAGFVAAAAGQRAEGYRLAFIRQADAVRAVAAFRSRGFGDQLFDWCVSFARQERCGAEASARSRLGRSDHAAMSSPVSAGHLLTSSRPRS